MKIETIKVKEAAKELGMSVLTLRGLMQDGTLQIGYVVGKQGQRKTFIIYREAVEREKRRLCGGEEDGTEENRQAL